MLAEVKRLGGEVFGAPPRRELVRCPPQELIEGNCEWWREPKPGPARRWPNSGHHPLIGRAIQYGSLLVISYEDRSYLNQQ